MLQIEIKRKQVRGEACDGSLSINGKFVCDTAENARLMPRAGTYRVKMGIHPRLKRKLPVIALPDGRNVWMSSGNGIYNARDALIVVGTHLVPGCVTHSRQAFRRILPRINMALRRAPDSAVIIIS